MKPHVIPLIGILFLLSASLVVGINGQKAPQAQGPDVSQFPTLDYEHKKPAIGSERRRKKYNSRSAPKISEKSDVIATTSDWEIDLPALPVDKSEAVIVGEVTAAEALLSEDETNIYSEFTVVISEVIKNDKDYSLRIGNSVVVERIGGRVRMPSGKLVISFSDHQDFPGIGKRYVLFLNREKADEDLHILTGYELRNGKVFPLDKLSPEHPITAYAGMDETSFLADLNQAVLSSSSNTR